MIPKTPQINFGSIKGIAKVNSNDKSGKPIDIPDGEKLTISGNKDQIRLSNDPSRAYAMVQINNVDNKSELELKDEANINIDTIKNLGKVSLYNNSKADINEAQNKGEIEQFDNSYSSTKNINKSALSLNDKAASDINLRSSSDVLLDSESALNLNKMNIKPGEKSSIIQWKNSKSDIKEINSSLEPIDRSSLQDLSMIATYNNSETNIGNIKDVILYQGNNSKSRVSEAEKNSYIHLVDKSQSSIKCAHAGSNIKAQNGTKLEITEDKRSWIDKMFS